MPRWHRRACFLAFALIGLPAVVTGGYAAAGSGIDVRLTPSRSTPGGQVTLVTGDVVRMHRTDGGRYVASIEPGPGRHDVTFHTHEVDDELRVIPQDAVPYVSAGLLDTDLFEVSRLLSEGYGGRSTLPLIVQYGAPGADGLRGAGVRRTRDLTSINGASMSVRRDALGELWKELTRGRDQATVARPSFAAGVSRIWLDGRVHATLEESTAQIGAPRAWETGLDGAGVDVAVLDTGVDFDHPDFEGRIELARDFTGGGTVQDGHGHGSHVAGIVLGSGVASEPRRRGVAPAADLMVGKVLTDKGSGAESWIIDGMEWAAQSGAEVVNMSLGGPGGDGTDPMSVALDTLTAETGALFVVAAGNDGQDMSIGAPGVAGAALTVGAVDRNGDLASFSSRGPRPGDLAVKPEITGPGVGIAAPRAGGTAMGTPVDEHYTRASGTSMASPHVAGAAALLAQLHPEWGAEQLKAALVSSALPTSGRHAFEQGAGLVQVDRALEQPVHGTGVLNLGRYDEEPPSAPQVITTHYVNTSSQDVALDLSVELTGVRTGESENDAVSLPQASVVVPAGGKAAVDLRLEPALLAAGWHAGYLTATGPDDVRVTTALGAAVAPPTHTVTFAGVDRTGGSAGVPVLTLFGGGETTDHINYVPPDGTTTLEVEEDTYILTGLIEDGAPLDEQATLITDPELTVDRDMTITLDAREATPIQVRTPQPAEQRGILSYYTHRVTGEGRAIAHGVMHFSTVRKVNVSPTAPTERGSFEFSSRWQLEAPMVTAAVAGVADELEFNLLHSSPAYTGTRRWPLVSAGHGTPAELAAANVRGKAVVVEADPANVPEHQQVEAAADAGAATIAIVRDADMSAWTVWTPQGERLPIPATVVPHDDGQVLLAAARTGTSRLSLTLQTSSPYLYDVMHVEKDAVPNRIVHEVTKANSQRLEVDYAHLGGFPWTKEQRFGWRPWQTYAWNDRQRFVKTPHQRTEWVSTGDTLWQQRVHHEYFWDDSSPLLGGLAHPPRNYEAGSSTASWYRPLIRPAAPGGPGAPVSTRTAQQLSLRVPELVDADGHYGYLEGWDPDSASMTVTRDGEPIGEATSGWLDVETTAATADYVVSLGTRRISDEWAYSTRTHTEWRFRSGAPSTGSAALPMLQVDYRLGASGPAEVEFRDQTDTRGVKLRDLVVSVSTDGGTTWRQVAVRRLAANRYEFVAPRRGTGTAAVRVIAEDMSGSEVRQTVFDAYHLHP